MISEKEINIVRKILHSTPAEYRPIRAYIYGSRARGDAEDYSDLDILVELDRPVDRTIKNSLRHVAWELSIEHGFVISVAIVAKDDFEHGALAKSGFACNIRKEGVVIAA